MHTFYPNVLNIVNYHPVWVESMRCHCIPGKLCESITVFVSHNSPKTTAGGAYFITNVLVKCTKYNVGQMNPFSWLIPSSRRYYDACKIGLILEKNLIHYTNGLKGKHQMIVFMRAAEVHFQFCFII